MLTQFMWMKGKAYRSCDSSIREFTIAELQALAVKTVVDYYDSIQQSLELEGDQLIEAIHKMVLTLQQLTN